MGLAFLKNNRDGDDWLLVPRRVKPPLKVEL